MFQAKLLKTTTFRAALFYLAVFCLSSVAVTSYLYWNTAGVMMRQTDQEIMDELDNLSGHFERSGVPGIIRIVKRRSRDPRLSLYLLADPQGRKLAGNLSNLPDYVQQPDNWVHFEYRRVRDTGTKTTPARGRLVDLPLGFSLLVARDVDELRQLDRLMGRAMIYGLGIILFMGVTGGLLISRNFRSRIDSINRASRQIMDGDLSRRVPIKGTDDEIDQLSENLNSMLDRIEDLMKGMRQVTDNVAHDLRSPINRLRNRLEVTLMQENATEKYREVLQSTIEEADGLLATFNALLSITRLEAGTAEVQMERMDLGRLVEDAADFLAPVAEERGFKYQVIVPDEKIEAMVSRPLMSQAVVNIIDNALKYGRGEDSEIVIAVTESHEEVTVSVSDKGPGIPVDQVKRVTERFVRLDESRTRQGSGLGLSLVSAIIQIHRGRLQLSRNDPQGLVAQIVLNKSHDSQSKSSRDSAAA
ncbi:MAG: sensor histidine kinase [Parvibaculales bacterium]